MKVKQFLIISNMNQFLKREYSSCFTLTGYEADWEDWHVVGPITIEVPDEQIPEMALKAIKIIDEAVKEKTEKYNKDILVLKTRKQELMALPGPKTE